MATKVEAIKTLGSALGVTVEGSTIAESIHSLVRGLGATDTRYIDEPTIAASIADMADAVEDGAISVGGGEVTTYALTVTRGAASTLFAFDGIAYLGEYEGDRYIGVGGYTADDMGDALTATVKVIAPTGQAAQLEVSQATPTSTSGAIQYVEEAGIYMLTGDATINFG